MEAQKTALVVNAGTHPEPYQVAVGLAEVGWSVDYITGSQFAASAITDFLMRVMPIRAKNQMSARLLTGDVHRLRRVICHGFAYEIVYLVLRGRMPAAAKRALSLRTSEVARRAAREVARDRPYDLVVAQHTSALAPFVAAPESTGCVLLQPILDAETLNSFLLADARNSPSWAELLPQPVDSAQQNDEIEHSDLVVTGSEFVARPIRERYYKPAFSAHYGTARPVTRAERVRFAGPGPLRVLFAGQVNQRKGIGYLLDAVRGSDQTIRLRIAGQAGDAVKQRARNMSNVTFLGPLSRVDLEREYLESDVLVLPSLAEGFALVVTEAMATGLPCVVSDRTGAHEVIRHGVDGFVVPAGDAEALRQQLAHLASNKDLLSLVGDRARETAKGLTWDTFRRTVALHIDRYRRGSVQ